MVPKEDEEEAEREAGKERSSEAPSKADGCGGVLHRSVYAPARERRTLRHLPF